MDIPGAIPTFMHGLRRNTIDSSRLGQSYKFSAMKVPSFTLTGFRRPREIVGLALAKLERHVMEEIWRRGETNLREA